jgi:hypothetical protein
LLFCGTNQADRTPASNDAEGKLPTWRKNMINLSTLMPLLIAGLVTQDALAHGSPDHYKFDAKSG